MIQKVLRSANQAASLGFLRADAHLLGENVSLPYMHVDRVERCWKEQVLALTVERLPLVKVQHMRLDSRETHSDRTLQIW